MALKLHALFGDEFKIESERDNVRKISEKLKKPKEISTSTILKSKSYSIKEKIKVITKEVLRILGVYKENTILLNDVVSLKEYIDASIKNKIIVIDTETNNSLDPLTCKLMGLCLYTPGKKNAYAPVNHTDEDGNLIPGQVTEQQIYEELTRVNNSDCKIIFHNAKFDYEVIYCTCGIKLRIDWDTYIAATMIDENERAGLKEQFITKIDPTIEKYSIEKLFKDISYNFVPPDIFSLYAATDSYMTYKLYEWQKTKFESPDLKKVFYVFENIEMPMIEVCAAMELTGICLDDEYSKRLSAKYHKLADELDNKIVAELSTYDKTVSEWRLTPEANYKEYVLPDGTTGFLPDDDPIAIASKGNPKLVKKSMASKLDTPINLASPTQLIIFLYYVLKLPPVMKSTGKGSKRHDIMSVDEDALLELAKAHNIKLLNLLIEQRGLNKLISTYIDKLPTCVSPRDGRLHTGFKQLGAACITKESLILTDSGYIRIGDLFDDFEIDGEFRKTDLTIINKNLDKETSEYRIAYRKRKTKKLELCGGYYIEGTYNHPIICSSITQSDIYRNHCSRMIRRIDETSDFKKLEDIQVGDLVKIPVGYNIFPTEYKKLNLEIKPTLACADKNISIPELCDENFAEFLGMYFADGSVKNNPDKFKIVLSNRDKEVQDRFEYLVKILFNATCTRSAADIRFGSVRIRSLEKYLPVGAREKIVPDIIMQSPKSVVMSFIRGITLDSSYDKARQRLSITVANEQTNLFVKTALLNAGIISTAHNGVYKATHDHMGNIVSPKKVCRICVSGEMYHKFLNEVGTIQSRKTDIRDSYAKSRFMFSNNCFYARVKSISDGVNDVYDLNVPETHSFISNGIISHNTGRMSSNEPNIQNIPSHNPEIRMMFTASTEYCSVKFENTISLNKQKELETTSGWKQVSELNIGDLLILEDGTTQVINNIEENEQTVIIYI